MEIALFKCHDRNQTCSSKVIFKLVLGRGFFFLFCLLVGVWGGGCFYGLLGFCCCFWEGFSCVPQPGLKCLAIFLPTLLKPRGYLTIIKHYLGLWYCSAAWYATWWPTFTSVPMFQWQNGRPLSRTETLEGSHLNPHTWDAEAGRCLGLRPTWSTW